MEPVFSHFLSSTVLVPGWWSQRIFPHFLSSLTLARLFLISSLDSEPNGHCLQRKMEEDVWSFWPSYGCVARLYPSHCTKEHLYLMGLGQRQGGRSWKLRLGWEQDYGDQLYHSLAKADGALGPSESLGAFCTTLGSWEL